MSALPRPDLPAGAHRDLNDALHELHHQAGWPSLRTLARETGVSRTTVSKTFSSAALPTWGTLELLVEAVHGDARTFHQLWLSASAPTEGSIPTTPRIAGRKAELAAVRRHLEAGTGLLLVTGEAGMGKTALVTAAAGGLGTFVATGHCLPLATEIPLLPVADVLRDVIDAHPDWFDSALAACAPYVAASLAVLIPEAAAWARDVQVRIDDRQLLFTAVDAVVRALAADRPTALLVEDFHWADPATLDLVEHLLRRCPVPVVGTWRAGDEATPAPSEEWFTRVRRLPGTTVLALSPLTREETAEQLRMLGAGTERLDTIHARSEGQPLFTEQLAAHLDDGPGLPDLLADLLDRRLAGIVEESWAVLRLLGVAARPLRPELLAAATGLAPEELTAELRNLQVRRLLRRTEGTVELQHPLLAESVQRRLVPGEDASAHRALALTIGDAPDAEPAEVAEHWRRAGDTRNEIDWRLAAARRAAARFDRRQEADHYLRALEIWPDSRGAVGDPAVTRADAYLGAMDGLRTSFRWDRAAELSDAADQALTDIDARVRAELLYRSADYRSQQRDPRWAGH